MPKDRAEPKKEAPPYEAVPLQTALWWHPVHTHAVSHIWLRDTAARVGERLAADGR